MLELGGGNKCFQITPEISQMVPRKQIATEVLLPPKTQTCCLCNFFKCKWCGEGSVLEINCNLFYNFVPPNFPFLLPPYSHICYFKTKTSHNQSEHKISSMQQHVTLAEHDITFNNCSWSNVSSFTAISNNSDGSASSFLKKEKLNVKALLKIVKSHTRTVNKQWWNKTATKIVH